MVITSLGGNSAEIEGKGGLIGVHRGLAFGVKRTSGPFLEDDLTWSDLRRLVASDPFGFLADFNDRSPWLEALTDHPDRTWLSDFQHRMIILVASFANLPTGSIPDLPSNDGNSLIFVNNALRRVKKFVEEVIRFLHPEEAATILASYLPRFMQYVIPDEDDSDGL